MLETPIDELRFEALAVLCWYRPREPGNGPIGSGAIAMVEEPLLAPLTTVPGVSQTRECGLGASSAASESDGHGNNASTGKDQQVLSIAHPISASRNLLRDKGGRLARRPRIRSEVPSPAVLDERRHQINRALAEKGPTTG